jgi:tyrosine-protein kinase Etk/Wzc
MSLASTSSSNSQPSASVVLAPASPALGAADGVMISELAQIVRRHRRHILAIAAFLMLAGMSFALFTRMRFATKSRLYLGELEDKGRPDAAPSHEIELASSGRSDLGSEIEILESRSLVSRAVLASGLNAVVTMPTWSPPRYLTWLMSGRSPRLLDAPSEEIAVVDTYLADPSAPSATFHVTFVDDAQYEVRSGGRVIGHGKLGDTVQAEGLILRLMPGTRRGPAPGSRYDVDVLRLDDVIDGALQSLEIATPANKAPTSGETLKIADLYFTHRSPQKAAAFLEQLMMAYLEERHAWKTETATAAEAFLTTQLSQTRSTLDDLQNKLAAFRAEHGVVVLDTRAKAMVQQLGVYEEQRVAARMQVEALAAVTEQLKAPNPPVEAFMLGEAKDDMVLVGLATNLAQSQQKLAAAEARYNPPAPEVQNQRAQLAAELEGIRRYVDTRLTRARENLRNLNVVIAQSEDKLRTVPSAEVGLARLTRETEVYSAVYSQLLQQQQEAALVKASAISKNRVLDHAAVPYSEQTLKPYIGLLSGPIGLVLGALFVILRSVVSGRFQHVGDVRRHLGDAPIIASIPHVAHKPDQLPVECVEAFRTLRVNVYGACLRERGNVVLFTSPCSGDGKTTCANLLASALARGNRLVLFVDAGLRPNDGARASDPRELGLGDVLSGGQDWREVVRENDLSSGHRFFSIHGGREESTDLLSSPAMAKFMDEVRAVFDFILVEAPSYPAVSDTLILSRMADYVVDVIRLEHTSRALALDNFQQLAVSASRYGLALNDVRS